MIGTGIPCDMCNNNWGARRIDVRLDGAPQFIYVCLVCGEGKTDFQIFKIVYPKKFKQN
jgi:hypothetical protein